MAETPFETIRRAKVVVDQKQGCLAEAGDLTQPIEQGLYKVDDIHGALGEIVTNQVNGRASQDDVTVFKSVGIAVQDLVTADLALKLAEESEIDQQNTL
ncbi:hypothetical protein LA52FAK_17450 [Desulforhopalus sp. 52FAK]